MLELRNRMRNFEPVKYEWHMPQHPCKNDFGGQSHQIFHNRWIFLTLKNDYTTLELRGRRAERGDLLRSSKRSLKATC